MAEPRFDVTTLGEMLIRLSVPSGERLQTARQLDMHPAGAEANVATLLARLGRRTHWTGALPKNALGRLAAESLRAAGVDTAGILWREGGRMATYYVEFAAPPRGIQVTYDRAGSCAAGLAADELDWNSILDARLLHLTGITPALSASCRAIVLEAVARAKASGVPISFDVNFREKLWSAAEAAKTIMPLVQGVDLLFCNAADAARVFSYAGPKERVAQDLLECTRARHLVVTFAEQGALLWNGKEWLHEPARPTQIVDRLGAGDALASGVIHGWLAGDLSAGLRYGVTLAALALSQHGDMTITTQQELLSLCGGGSALTR